MDAVVLIPGVTGSSLDLGGKEIWPPDLDEVLSHYKRISLLLSDRVQAKDVIDWVIVPCAQIYAPIIQDLQEICFQTGAKYVEFAYDWRVDIATTARRLSDRLDHLVNNEGVTSITLVCHSMGGLVARILLENGAPSPRFKWHGRVKKLLCICTPHLGSPLALAKCMGLEGDSTISAADTKKLCDSKYPTAYQLLPPESETFVLSGQDNSPLDIYRPDVANQLLLNVTNLATARSTSALHNLEKKPKAVAYTFVFATNHSTDQRFKVTGLSVTAETDHQGDGIVPSRSAGFTGTQRIRTWSTPGDHVGVLAVQAFRNFLFKFFGMASAAQSRLARGVNVAVLSPNKRSYAPGEAMRVLIIPDQGAAKVDTTIRIERYETIGPVLRNAGSIRAQSRGGRAAFVAKQFSAPAEPGTYRLTLTGSHTTVEGTHAWFIVSTAAGRAIKMKRSLVHRSPNRKRKTRSKK